LASGCVIAGCFAVGGWAKKKVEKEKKKKKNLTENQQRDAERIPFLERIEVSTWQQQQQHVCSTSKRSWVSAKRALWNVEDADVSVVGWEDCMHVALRHKVWVAMQRRVHCAQRASQRLSHYPILRYVLMQ
jgi:hypothetical protein